jgi:hypothetical protein
MPTDFFSKKDVQNLLDAEDAAIASFVSKLKNKIERILNKVAKDLSKETDLNKIVLALNQLEATNLPEEVRQHLASAINLYKGKIKELSESIRTINNINEVLSQADQAVINQLFNYSQTKIITNIQQTFNDFRAIAYESALTKTLPNIESVIATLTDKLEGRLPAEINTQLAGFQRTLAIKKAEDLELTHFLYAGGLIKTSREFCIERAGKIFTLDEARSWDNEQGLPFIPYMGGYNCRHSMVLMTKEKAIENGWQE